MCVCVSRHHQTRLHHKSRPLRLATQALPAGLRFLRAGSVGVVHAGSFLVCFDRARLRFLLREIVRVLRPGLRARPRPSAPLPPLPPLLPLLLAPRSHCPLAPTPPLHLCLSPASHRAHCVSSRARAGGILRVAHIPWEDEPWGAHRKMLAELLAPHGMRTRQVGPFSTYSGDGHALHALQPLCLSCAQGWAANFTAGRPANWGRCWACHFEIVYQESDEAGMRELPNYLEMMSDEEGRGLHRDCLNHCSVSYGRYWTLEAAKGGPRTAERPGRRAGALPVRPQRRGTRLPPTAASHCRVSLPPATAASHCRVPLPPPAASA